MTGKLLLVRARLALGRRRAWLGWAGALAVWAVFILPLRGRNPVDYYGFWIIGQTIHQTPVTNIYTYRDSVRLCTAARRHAGAARSRLERTFRDFYKSVDSASTPFLFSVFSITAGGDFLADYNRHRVAFGVLYGAGLLAFAAYLRYPPWSYPLLLWLFTAPFWPYRRDVIDANNSAALSGGVMMGLLLLSSPRPRMAFAAGLALGLLAAFKPTTAYAPALALVALAFDDRRALARFAAGLAAAVVIALAVPPLVLGPACTWGHWWRWAPNRAFQLREMSGGVPGRLLGIESRAAYRLFSPLMLAVFTAIVIFIFRRPASTVMRRLVIRNALPGFGAIAAGALGLVCYLLSGPLVWGHYFCLAVPAGLIAMRPRPDRADGGWPVRAAGLLSCLLFGLHQVFRRWGWTTWANHSPLTIAGVVIAAAAVTWDLWDSRRLTVRPRADSVGDA